MSSILVRGYGSNVEELVTQTDSKPRPKLKKGDKSILVRVLAVSLAPGDCRVMSGKTTLVQAPYEMPYTPGGDLCGVVEEVHEGDPRFKPGDVVVAMFDTAGPHGALAEYKKVKTSHAALKPPSVPDNLSCALPSSALSAMIACEKYVRKGDRVLVLGGSGGVGCHLIQMLKPLGATFVAATSTQQELLLKLGADRVLDYRTESWWTVPEFCDAPFDLIFDLWGTREPWEKARMTRVLKNGFQGGRYITFAGDVQEMVVQHWWHIAQLIFRMLGRQLWTTVFRSNPTWIYHVGLEPDGGNLDRLLRMVDQKQLQPVLDPSSPFAFDAESVRTAFQLQRSRHAHGKVVIQVAQR